MSFILEYHPFINVVVQEDGTSAVLPALGFTPTPACRQVLADRHLVYRPREAGFQLFYRSNPMAGDPLLGAITSRIRFTFAVFLKQAELFETYEPDLTAETGPQLYFDNLTPTGNIQTKNTLTTSTVVQTSDASRIYPTVFQTAADLGVPSPPTTWRVLDKFSPATVVLSVPISTTSSGLAQTKIDLSTKSAGPYTLATDVATPPARTIYVDEGLAQSGITGVVDLYWEARQDTVPSSGLDYFIRFRKR